MSAKTWLSLLHHSRMPDQWSRVDDLIVNAQYLPALREIRSAAGVGLKEAIDIFSERYDDFTLPPGEYGRGVYTSATARGAHGDMSLTCASVMPRSASKTTAPARGGRIAVVGLPIRKQNVRKPS